MHLIEKTLLKKVVIKNIIFQSQKKNPKEAHTYTYTDTDTHPSCLLHHQVSDLLVEMQLTFASIEGDVGPEGTEIILELDTNNTTLLSTHITNTKQLHTIFTYQFNAWHTY